jgi:hypothetical protein
MIDSNKNHMMICLRWNITDLLLYSEFNQKNNEVIKMIDMSALQLDDNMEYDVDNIDELHTEYINSVMQLEDELHKLDKQYAFKNEFDIVYNTIIETKSIPKSVYGIVLKSLEPVMPGLDINDLESTITVVEEGLKSAADNIVAGIRKIIQTILNIIGKIFKLSKNYLKLATNARNKFVKMRQEGELVWSNKDIKVNNYGAKVLFDKYTLNNTSVIATTVSDINKFCLEAMKPLLTGLASGMNEDQAKVVLGNVMFRRLISKPMSILVLTLGLNEANAVIDIDQKTAATINNDLYLNSKLDSIIDINNDSPQKIEYSIQNILKLLRVDHKQIKKNIKKLDSKELQVALQTKNPNTPPIDFFDTHNRDFSIPLKDRVKFTLTLANRILVDSSTVTMATTKTFIKLIDNMSVKISDDSRLLT